MLDSEGIIDGSGQVATRKHFVRWLDSGRTEVVGCDGSTLMTYTGDCRDGCCSDYLCSICGKTLRVEWPD